MAFTAYMKNTNNYMGFIVCLGALIVDIGHDKDAQMHEKDDTHEVTKVVRQSCLNRFPRMICDLACLFWCDGFEERHQCS